MYLCILFDKGLGLQNLEGKAPWFAGAEGVEEFHEKVSC